MGMSASQARFLILTAQKNNNEYQAQRITHERLMLAQETEGYTSVYNEKMNNTTLLFNAKTPADSDLYNYNRKLTYDDIVRPATDENNPGIGGRLVTTSGKMVVPKLPEFDQNGLSSDGLTEKDYFIDPEIARTDVLQRTITEGIYFIALKKYTGDLEEDPSWQKVDYSNTQETYITETLDKTDDAAAQSDYDEMQNLFQNKDKTLELRLKQLESEHKALETEMESVQKVIKDNVEASFKTFG